MKHEILNKVAKIKEGQYTIVDHLQKLSYTETVLSPPYNLHIDDYEEIASRTFLQTKESITRVAIRTIDALDLKVKNRKRYIVDRRRFMFYILVVRANNTLTFTGNIFNKDHATVLYHIRQIPGLQNDKEYIENTKALNQFFNHTKFIDK